MTLNVKLYSHLIQKLLLKVNRRHVNAYPFKCKPYACQAMPVLICIFSRSCAKLHVGALLKTNAFLQFLFPLPILLVLLYLIHFLKINNLISFFFVVVGSLLSSIWLNIAVSFKAWNEITGSVSLFAYCIPFFTWVHFHISCSTTGKAKSSLLRIVSPKSALDFK